MSDIFDGYTIKVFLISFLHMLSGFLGTNFYTVDYIILMFFSQIYHNSGNG